MSYIELREKDFELMHHYCTVTADTMSLKPEIRQVWRNIIPREGYRHSFIMHGILASAATHKAYLFPYNRKTYLNLATYHQTVGSEGFRSALQANHSENTMALFAFAGLMVMHMMALPGRCPNGILEDPIQHFMELVGMFRGLMVTLSPLMSTILRTELAPLVYSVWPLNESDMPER